MFADWITFYLSALNHLYNPHTQTYQVLYNNPCQVSGKYSSVSKWFKAYVLLMIVCIRAAYEPLPTPPAPTATAVPVWQDRTIASSKLRMLEYSAFMEVQRDPDNVS